MHNFSDHGPSKLGIPQILKVMRSLSIKSPAPKEQRPISSFPRDVPAVQLWWTQSIHSWRQENELKSLDHALMTQQYLTWSANPNFCRRRKARVLRAKILGWEPKGEKSKYPNILEIFALRAGSSWFLIRSLKSISRYKYQLVFNFNT